MTSGKLYGILKFLDLLDSELDLQKNLERISKALDSLASSPAQPELQTSLSGALTSFEKAVAQMNTAISPSQLGEIKAMGGEEFFDPSIFEKVKSTIQLNAMTPSVASEFVEELAERRESFLATVRSARKALEGLKLSAGELAPGSADLAFLIPRDIFENKLGRFAKELNFINRLIEHYSEAITGTVETAQLEQLSSSVPTVALLAAVPVIGALAAVVNKFLDAWEKIEKIRKIRAELENMALDVDALDQLDQRITSTVDQVVEESTELVISHYTGDASRKSELRTAVRQDTHRLFGQIERGLTVEFHAKPEDESEDGETQKALQNIKDLSTKMKFPEVDQQPVLLSAGELLDGEIKIKQTKKTTTRKTSTEIKKVTKGGDDKKD